MKEQRVPGSAKVVFLFFLFFLLLVALSGAGLLGCASQVRVIDGADADFLGLSTWAWDARGVEVEADHDTQSLRGRVSAQVEAALAERGFRRVETDAELLVTALVSVERRERFVRTGMAPRLVDSYHASASYWVEGEVIERRVVENLRIGLELRPTGRGQVWRAVTGEMADEMHALPTEVLVSRLLDHLPEAPARPPRSAPALPAERLADRSR